MYAAQCKYEATGEWVFDLLWSQEHNKIIFDMPLAMECEWEPSGILQDFQKLFISRARHWIIVCWQNTPALWEIYINSLIKQINCYQGTQSGDRYLFCAWIEPTDKLMTES